MASRRLPQVHSAADALDANATLATLLAGHRRSQAWFATVREELGPLASQVRPGPIEEQTWTLLVNSGSAAAKARQLLPRLIERLQGHGQVVSEIRVKVMPARA